MGKFHFLVAHKSKFCALTNFFAQLMVFSFCKKNLNGKSTFFQWKKMSFWKFRFWIFFPKNFQIFVFEIQKNIFSWSWKKKLDIVLKQNIENFQFMTFPERFGHSSGVQSARKPGFRAVFSRFWHFPRVGPGSTTTNSVHYCSILYDD